MARKMMGIGFGALNTTFPSQPTTNIISISVATGVAAGGTAVRVVMENATAGTTITVGGNTATITASVYGIEGHHDITTPAHAAGAVDFVVTDLYGTATLSGGFTYASATLTAGSASASSGDTEVSLTATAPTGGTAPYTYQWYRSTSNGVKGSAIVGATTLSYTNTGLVNGTPYYFTLDATDDVAATVSYTQRSATPGNYATPDILNVDFDDGTDGALVWSPSTTTAISIVADPTGQLSNNVGRIRYNRTTIAQATDLNRSFRFAIPGASQVGLSETVFIRAHIVQATPSPAIPGTHMRKLIYVQRSPNNSSFCVIRGDNNNLTVRTTSATGTERVAYTGVGLFPYDTKVSVEIQITTNSAHGLSDGEMKFWVNGSLVADLSPANGNGVQWLENDPSSGAPATNPFTNIYFGSQSQNVTDPSGTLWDYYRYFDKIAVSTQRIGPG